jgi:signal transduction histidine kinase
MFAELLTEAARSGFLRIYLWPESRSYPIEWLPVGAQASLWTFALFMRSFVPRVLSYRRTYRAFGVVLIVLTLGFAWAPSVDYASGIRFWTWWFWLVVAALVALVARATRDGIREARVILGYIALLAGLELFRLFVILGYMNFSFLQAVLSPWTYVLSTLMLLMAVGQRTTLIRNELIKVDADSAARLDFILGVGHELRSPLNAIVGQTRLPDRSSFNSEQRSGLLSIRQNAKQMLTMMDEILDYTKSQGRHLRPVSWELLTDRMKYDALALAVEQTDRMELSFYGARDVLLQVDIRRVLQVIHNLLQNAVRYANGAPFGLKCQLRPPSFHDGDSRWIAEFEVWDTGPGIDVQDQLAVFQPFLRGRQAHLSHLRGLGMGLAISRQLVRAIGGELLLSSAPGMGCRFRFSMRLEQAVAADLEDAESGPRSLPGDSMLPEAEDSGPAELMTLSDAARQNRQPSELQLAALMELLENGQVS